MFEDVIVKLGHSFSSEIQRWQKFNIMYLFVVLYPSVQSQLLKDRRRENNIMHRTINSCVIVER